MARIGGITPWLKTAHMAEACNVPVCPHVLMELHVAPGLGIEWDWKAIRKMTTPGSEATIK